MENKEYYDEFDLLEKADMEYDAKVERILLSDDYQKCKHRTANGHCLLYKVKGMSCWHVWKCPLGKARR